MWLPASSAALVRAQQVRVDPYSCRSSGLNIRSWSMKELEGLPVLCMAQAEAMD